jgi:mono/diheme cytochrome c family protein
VAGRDLDERAWTFLIAGIILLGITYAALKPAPAPKPPSALPTVPQLDPAMIPLATGEEPIDVLFIKPGCPVCHTIPGIQGAGGRVGPKLVLGTTGPRRLADPRYRGQAKTVREYIIESVISPGVYVAFGYPDQVMPRWYGQKLSAGALEKMAGYLETLKEAS